jgi:hypothetical protein
MRRLRAISAVFTASAGLDAEQTATLHFFAAPMFEMNCPALRDEIEEGLMIALVQLIKSHRAGRLNERSAMGNRKE